MTEKQERNRASGDNSTDPGGILAHSSALLRQTVLSRAADLARFGRYSQAESLIMDIIQEDDPDIKPSVLDLLARIRAQQGRISEAESLWLKASKLAPSNEAYRDALERIADMQKRPVWLATLWTLFVGVVFLAAILLLGFSGMRFIEKRDKALISEITLRNKKTQLILASEIKDLREIIRKETTRRRNDMKVAGRSDVPTTGPDFSGIEAGTGGKEGDTGKTSRSFKSRKPEASAKKGHSGVEKPLELKIKARGIIRKASAKEVVIKFKSGLFKSGVGTTLSPGTRVILSTLGQDLEKGVGRISVKVVGYSDNIPISSRSGYHDNKSLGMARSVAVVEYLRSYCNLPISMFEISSAGDENTPYPNDTEQNRARNRTVVIRISNIKK